MLLFCHHKNIVSPNHENGFTLIEVMVAIVIFTIGILGCYKLQLHTSYSNILANSVSNSATWATYTVEQLLAKDYDDSSLNDTVAGAYAGTGGLNATGANADGALYIRPDGSTNTSAAADDLYSVYWNVVEGTTGSAGTGQAVLAGTKQIRVIVIKNAGIGKGTLYTHDYFKTAATL